jgi:GTP cyclohydrolase I
MNNPTPTSDFLQKEIDALANAVSLHGENPPQKVLSWLEEVDLPKLTEHAAAMLTTLGEDLTEEGKQRTPERYARFLADFLNPDPVEMTVFAAPEKPVMVLEKNIPFYSLCEHHLLPFFGTVAIAYMPSRKVLGLSKLARLVELCSRRLQMQERLTTDIAHILDGHLAPRGIAVHIKARHLCQEMRGIKAYGAETETTYFSGVFETATMKTEFLQRIAT